MSKIHGFYTPEAIDFQDTSFFDELTRIFESNRQDTDQNRSNLVADLEAAIKKRMGLNINIVFDPYSWWCAIPPLDRNSPLMKDYFDQNWMTSDRTISDIRKSSNKQVEGLIDLKAARVYGYFADMRSTDIGISENEIFNSGGKDDMTARELASSLLHEIGHLFVLLEFFVRFRTTNQILAAAVRDMDKTTDFEKRAIIIREAGSALNVKLDVDPEELSNKKTETVFLTLVSSYKKAINSQNPMAGYDVTSAEALADQFAQRFGAGREIVTSLDKAFRRHGSIGSRSTAMYVVVEFAKLALIAVGTALAISTIVSPILIVYGTFFPAMVMIMSDSYDPRYDKPAARFKRIRDQIVNQLKDKKLNRQFQLRLQDDLKTIDEIIDRTKDHVQLLGLVYNYLIPGGISKRKSIEFQQGLESMSNNNLFAAASRLATGNA